MRDSSRLPCLLGLAMATAMCGPARADADPISLSIEHLMDLRVVGASKYEQRQNEVAAAVSLLTRDDIRRFGWRTIDEALVSLPGVYVTYDRQYSYLGLRGFGVPGDYTTRVLFTINGNRLNDSMYDGGPIGSAFPLDLDLVERIEFIPGPGGAVYGQNAMFGVVNVVTRQGAGLRGAEVAVGVTQPQRLREGRVSVGQRFDSGLDLLASASALSMRGEDRMMDFGSAGISGLAAGLDGLHDREWFVRMAHESWSMEAMRGTRRKDDPTGAYMSDPLEPGQYQADRYTYLQLQYQGAPSREGLQWQGRLFAGEDFYDSRLSYGATPGVPGSGNWYAYPSWGRWHGGELRLLYTGLQGHKLMLGAEAQLHRRVRQSILDLAAPANDIVIDSPGWRGGVYVQDEWRLASTLTSTLGLRLDRNNRTGTTSSPRAALIWQAAGATTLKALYGRAYRAPNAYEQDYDDGAAQVRNPNLRGERIDTLELVADHHVARLDMLLRAAAFQWTMRDLIRLGLDPLSGIPQYQSGGHVRAHGIEISADRTWPGGARLRGSLTWQGTRDEAGNALVNSPLRMAKLAALWPLARPGWHLAWEWQGESHRLTNDGSFAAGHAVSNLRVGAEGVLPGLSVGLGIRNVFDKRYVHPAADSNWQNTIEQDGRSLRLDAQLRF